MDFGQALVALKEGKKVCRSGWNGKGMYIFRGTIEQHMFPDETELFEVAPYIIMKTAQNNLVYGWLASQTDMFAEDWEVLN